MRVTDGKLPIILSALDTRPGRFSTEPPHGFGIRMYETHRPNTDSADVFDADVNNRQYHAGHAEPSRWGDDDVDGDWHASMSVTMAD